MCLITTTHSIHIKEWWHANTLRNPSNLLKINQASNNTLHALATMWMYQQVYLHKGCSIACHYRHWLKHDTLKSCVWLISVHIITISNNTDKCTYSVNKRWFNNMWVHLSVFIWYSEMHLNYTREGQTSSVKSTSDATISRFSVQEWTWEWLVGPWAI